MPSIPVELFQNRIDDLIGFNGKKISVYGENKDGRVLGRFEIRNEYTAETINMHHLLDGGINTVAQDPGGDGENVDIEPNIPYNLLNLNASLDYDLSVDVSSVKVGAISIRIGASWMIHSFYI